MKKIILLIIFSLALFAPVFVVRAVEALPQDTITDTGKVAGAAGYARADEFSVSRTVGSIIKVALSLIGTIFLGLTIYAGYLWMTAAGNEKSVETATSILKAAVIGLVLVLAGYGLTTFVVQALMRAT